MKKEITEVAKMNFKKIKAFQIVATVFGCVSILLFVISTQASAEERFAILFPTLIFILVLVILYVILFGFRSMREANLERDHEELEAEIARLFIDRTDHLQLKENLDMEDRLELLELERIKERVNIRNEE